MGERISNSLFHKLIQDKQAKLSIDTSKLNIEYLEGLYADNFEDNGSFIKAFIRVMSKVKEIFIEKEFPDSDGLKYSFFSKEDNQLSFILTINSKDDLEKILSFKLKKFYELNDRHLLL